jgi:predicted DsbA family dithiol-disulfide isomerase
MLYMKIDIWSDVACPYCYIGKRHLEAALAQFPHKDQVQVVWHNFELDPDAPAETKENQYEVVARKYGVSPGQAKEMTARVLASATGAGLAIDFDKVIPTNTFDAHRLIQLAASQGRQDEMEEGLFRAYFTEGRHIGQKASLLTIAAEIGIDATATLNSDDYTAEVRKDEEEAQTLGINGVPFFVFDYKYAISGAQPVNVFAQTLQKVWDEVGAGIRK